MEFLDQISGILAPVQLAHIRSDRVPNHIATESHLNNNLFGRILEVIISLQYTLHSKFYNFCEYKSFKEHTST